MKLVIVDDSLLILKFAEGTLIKNSVPVDIVLFSDGVEALDYVRSNQTDIMLLDIIMPGLNGMDILKTIKSDPILKDIEIIMFSSLDDKVTLHECFELGAVDYIGKPLEELEFLARIKSTIRKRTLERAALASLAEIETQNKSLTALNSKLKSAQNQIIQQEKMASVGHLAAGIAHEINNPLGFITSNFATLKKYIHRYQSNFLAIQQWAEENQSKGVACENLLTLVNDKEIEFINEDFPELFNDTQEGLNRVGVIVKGLRNFSRIDALEEMSEYNVNEGIENTLIISRNEIKYIANISLNLSPVPDIFALGGQVNQVILNIILNACAALKSKFTLEKGLIVITTWCDERSVYIKIRDNGIGISKQNIKHVFNPFYTTKPVGEGTGLGLSISYDIITTKHKGWIEVSSEEGQWTEFIISLPLGNMPIL